MYFVAALLSFVVRRLDSCVPLHVLSRQNTLVQQSVDIPDAYSTVLLIRVSGKSRIMRV